MPGLLYENSIPQYIQTCAHIRLLWFSFPTVLVCMKWKCGYVVWSSWWSHSPARPRWITSPSTIIQIHISADPSYLSLEASPLSIDLHDLSLDTVMPSSKALINHCQVCVCVCVCASVCFVAFEIGQLLAPLLRNLTNSSLPPAPSYKWLLIYIFSP